MQLFTGNIAPGVEKFNPVCSANELCTIMSAYTNARCTINNLNVIVITIPQRVTPVAIVGELFYF
jgi:hypothetical protein